MPQIEKFAPDLVSWRRALHAHPELRFEEIETADFVAKMLGEFGIEVSRGLARTGVVGTLKGRSGAKSIALRADMDALPMFEANTFAHASKISGRMHACGHDGHTTMLLGAARYLAETRNFSGTVHFVFQPGEEGGAGGRVMIEEGLFDHHPIDEIYALHNKPGLAFGMFAGREGAMLAAADRVEIVVTGRGGHAAEPHKAIDPIPIGAQIVTALQSIASRSVDPLESLVLSITEFHAGTAFNVIGDQAILRGTVRCFSESVRKLIQERIVAVSQGIAAAMGASAEVRYMPTYPPLINHRVQLDKALDAAVAFAGEEKVIRDMAPVMGAEDFAYMLAAKPGAYIFLGAGGGDNGSNLHETSYDFNDNLLTLGASYWCCLVEQILSSE